MTNFCPRCGSQSAPDQRFCTSCGGPLDAVTIPVAPSPGSAQVSSTATADMRGRSCPYCRFPLKEGGQVTECSSCHAVHHEDCYGENGGCAVAGCAGGPTAPHTQGTTVPPQLAAPAAGPIPGPVYAPPPPTGAAAQWAPPPPAGPQPACVGAAPHRAAPAPPPPKYPGASGRRWKTATIAILAGVVLLALAGGAAALVITSRGHSGSTLPASAATTTTDTGTTDSADTGTTAEPVAPPATTDTTPNPPPAPTPAADVLAAINQHWLDIKNGDYHAAFQLLAPSADGDSNESTWVASHSQDGITNVDYDFTVAWVNGNQARVNVDTLRTQDATGCHTFPGHYLMSQQSGSWLIAQVFLTEERC